jgi:hypothetical protein
MPSTCWCSATTRCARSLIDDSSMLPQSDRARGFKNENGQAQGNPPSRLFSTCMKLGGAATSGRAPPGACRPVAIAQRSATRLLMSVALKKMYENYHFIDNSRWGERVPGPGGAPPGTPPGEPPDDTPGDHPWRSPRVSPGVPQDYPLGSPPEGLPK